MQTILTITGSDSGSGSGIQADIKTISALGGYALSAITSITVQNTLGIQDIYDLPADVVKAQIEAIVNDVQPAIVKIGMIRTEETLAVIVGALAKYRPRHTVYDPVVLSTNGDRLLPDRVAALIRQQLLPLCSLVIVRRNEAGMILGDDRPDNIFYIDEQLPHGLGNSFASALAVYLSQDRPMDEAVDVAKAFLQAQIAHRRDLQGRSSQLYNEFLDIVEQHFRVNRDVNYYADCLNVSSRYLSQVARRVSGQSPKMIIDNVLTRSLRRELSVSGQTIQQIAYAYGFSSQAHFTKFFKKQTGFTPSDYRQMK